VKSRFAAGFTRSAFLEKHFTSAGLTVVALLFSACANSYEMKVDAISRSKPPTASAVAEAPVSYQIRSNNPQMDEDSLRFKEAAKYVKTALSGKGMYEAPNTEQADVIVNLDYGMGPPKAHMETESEPIYITVPGRTYTQTVQVGTDKAGNPIYQTIVSQDPPTEQYAGDREYQILVVTYEKYLRLTARQNVVSTEGRPPPEIWTVDVTSEGESKNLRKFIPILAAASIDYIGNDTRGEKTVQLKETKDGAVAFVKKGL
jgi:hypothetical protein